MSWTLSLEHDKLFLLINGKKAVDGKTLNQYGHVISAKPGNSAEKIKLSFSSEMTSTKNRNNFMENEEISIKKMESNTAFLKQLQGYGVEIPSTRGGKRPNQDWSLSPPTKRTRDVFMEEKCIGCYNVDIQLIDYAETTRPVRPALVQHLKEKIKCNPPQYVTLIPGIETTSNENRHDSCSVVPSQDLFTQDSEATQDLSSQSTVKRVTAIGGGHLLAAVRELLGEDPVTHSKLRFIPMRMYEDLTTDEMIKASMLYQEMCSTTPLTFQDKVWMVRKLIEEHPGDVVRRVNQLFGVNTKENERSNNVYSHVISVAKYDTEQFQDFQKIVQNWEKCKGQSSIPIKNERSNNVYSHVISVAKYDTEQFQDFQKIVQNWEKCKGQSSIPIKFFQKLQGASSEVRQEWLTRADVIGITDVTKELLNTRNTDCSSSIKKTNNTPRTERSTSVSPLSITIDIKLDGQIINLNRSDLPAEFFEALSDLKSILSSKNPHDLILS